MPYRIVAVTPAFDQPKPDLLRIADEKYKMVAVNDRLYFQEALIGKDPITVRLKLADEPEIWRQVPLHACRQRTSLQIGLLETGADVSGTEVRGRLVGCEMKGDWWIRATTLHGQFGEISDGFVDVSGSFSINVGRGQRHVFVIGKERDPVKSIAFNVVEGGLENDVGTVDLADHCP